jgi:lipoprotein-anchoring transpeptidase ErfK/SrfK
MTVCVDLTNQAMWVVQSGRIVLGPTAVRSGLAGNETPAGNFRITDKQLREVGADGAEQPYYAEFLDDIGFHTADKPIYSAAAGSAGCIHMLDRDAKALFRLTELGTTVNVFGRKPGT